MSVVRETSVSWADWKFVTLRAGMPRHRSAGDTERARIHQQGFITATPTMTSDGSAEMELIKQPPPPREERRPDINDDALIRAPPVVVTPEKTQHCPYDTGHPSDAWYFLRISTLLLHAVGDTPSE